MFYLIVTLKEKVYPPLEVSDYTGEMELCTRASDVTRPMINTIHSLKTSATGQKAPKFGPFFNFGNVTSTALPSAEVFSSLWRIVVE